MKVLMLNGSPHERGCTNRALLEVEWALNEEGIVTEILHVGSQSVHGCIACQKCSETGRCVFTYDLVNQVLDKMETADGLIVGSLFIMLLPTAPCFPSWTVCFMQEGILPLSLEQLLCPPGEQEPPLLLMF